MDPYLLAVLVGLLYALMFGALSLVRGEGLSTQFALEVVALTGLGWLSGRLTGQPVNPVLLLAVLYLVTMRTRLLVDLANALGQRGHLDWALRINALGDRLWPDAASHYIALINRGVLYLRQGAPEQAAKTLEGVLNAGLPARMGAKYEAACRYNLGVAWERLGRELEAVRQYNEVIELFPGSLYARGALYALQRRAAKGQEKQEEKEENL